MRYLLSVQGKAVACPPGASSGGLLEVLVHANLSQPPKNQRVVRMGIPDKLAVETVSIDRVEDWNAVDMKTSRAFGDRWILENRTAILRVPSVITNGRENNIVFNPAHSQFALVKAEDPEPAHWDARLFR
jgi:RES domain-containing protein